MSKMKRAVAIALAAAMTMGSTLTVFAEDTGSGETHGTGQNEGHVEKELINVILPTMPAEGSPFDYVTDPEGLIKATAGARYEDYTFPASDDTGVYFRVGEKEFANESETLQVINKSSCNVTITMTVGATASGGKDLGLAGTKEGMSVENPLYLHLKVGTTTDQAITSTGAEVKKTLAGDPNNFEIQYVNGAYQYVTRTEAAYWQSLKFSLAGEVRAGDVAADATAPTVDVTWAFAKADTGDSVSTDDQVQYEETAEPEILSISDYIKADPKDVVVKFSLGKGPDAVDADGAQLQVDVGGKKSTIGAAMCSVDMDSRTLTLSKAAAFLNNASADIPMYVVLTKGGSTVKELAGKIVVKNDYDDEPEIISVSDFTKGTPNDVVIKFSLGRGTGAVNADDAQLYVTVNGNKTAIGAAMFSVDMSSGTLTLSKSAAFLSNATADIPMYVALKKGGTEVKELSGVIKIK